MEHRINFEPMISLSRDTGGLSVEFRQAPGHWDSSSDWLSTAEAMGRQLSSLAAFSYELDLEMDRPVEVPTALKLTLVDTDGKQPRGLKIFYPSELMPCPTTEIAK